MSKKKKVEELTKEELYKRLEDEPLQITSQYSKAKDAGYNIYDADIKMSLEDLRNFRAFLSKNAKANEYSHNQLREIKLGFLNKLDVSKYMQPEYSSEEMRIYRKALIANFPIEKMQRFRTKEPSPEKSMQALMFAQREGYNFDEICNVPTDLLLYMSKKKSKEKIDILPLVKRGFDEIQIGTMLGKEYINPFSEKISDYVTPAFSVAQINMLGDIHTFYKYEDIKNLFDKKIAPTIFCTIKEKVYHNKNMRMLITPNVLQKITPSFTKYKVELYLNGVINGLSEEYLNLIVNSKCSDERYRILSYSYFTNTDFSIKLFDEKYSDANVTNAAGLITQRIIPDDILDLVEPLKLDKIQLNHLYRAINRRTAPYIGEILKYINKKTLPDEIRIKLNAVEALAKFKTVSDEEIEFIGKNIRTNNDLALIEKFGTKVKIQEINYDLAAVDFTSKTTDAFIKIEKATSSEIANKLLATLPTKLFCAIASQAAKGAEMKHLILLTPSSSMAVNMVVTLDEFNKCHERQIDVEEIIKLNATIREKGILISKLTSPILSENIEGYRMLNELQNTKKETKEEKER